MHLKIGDLDKPLYRDIPSAFHDLVEIATYVYCADQAVSRTGQDTDSFGAKWRQKLHLHIPVRQPDFWNRPEVQSALIETLDFLADHFFEFSFQKAASPIAFQTYLGLDGSSPVATQVDQVAMFSGGLDSLAGAVEQIVTHRHRVAFVTHLSTTKNNRFQQVLRDELATLAKPTKPIHVGVRVNKAKELGREYTQRTRSFLFATLGATVARMLGLTTLHFYENGVVSLNLPVCAQVVGGRASRTTHPRVLAGFSKLFSLVGETEFKVENPYLWLTKAEVIKRITDAGCGHLIASSVSCAHTWQRTKEHTHCGNCSQCIDRRMGIIAAGASHLDPEAHYKFDIFAHSPTRDDNRILAATYVERAKAMKFILTPNDLIARFPEVGRVLPYVGTLPADQAAQKILDLHQRHGREVEQALEYIVRVHVPDLIAGKLPGDCLIKIVTESRIATSSTAHPVVISNPENYFWRQGNVWEIRYHGGKPIFVQKHERGCAYLHFLIERQGETFSTSEIVADTTVSACDLVLDNKISEDELKSGFAISCGLPRTDGGEMVDRKAIAAYRDRLATLSDKLEEAKDFGNVATQAEIENEISTIASEMSRSRGISGAGRRMQDKLKNQRDALRNNVDRAIKEIRKHLPELADHLADRKCLRLGVENTYAPKTHVIWNCQPAVTPSAIPAA